MFVNLSTGVEGRDKENIFYTRLKFILFEENHPLDHLPSVRCRVSYRFLRNNTVDFPSLLSLYQNITCTCFVDNLHATLTTRAFETFHAWAFITTTILHCRPCAECQIKKKFSKCFINTLFFTRWRLAIRSNGNNLLLYKLNAARKAKFPFLNDAKTLSSLSRILIAHQFVDFSN